MSTPHKPFPPAHHPHGQQHADLAFVDAAIDMYKAVHAKPESASAQGAATKVDPDCWVDVALATAVVVYHAWNRLMPDTASTAQHSPGDRIGSGISLAQMIERRNRLASALGQSELSS